MYHKYLSSERGHQNLGLNKSAEVIEYILVVIFLQIHAYKCRKNI